MLRSQKERGLSPSHSKAIKRSVRTSKVTDSPPRPRRTGTPLEGRFKASLVDIERYLLTCMRYIEFNHVRAGLVTDSGYYRWPSYRSHIGDAALNW